MRACAQRPQQSRTILYATDRAGSVLAQVQAGQPDRFAYTPFGHRPLMAGIGFNGELPDPLTGHYLLGNGYRAYNPVLVRFNSPDSLSPFGKGGVNAYAYCAGDPVNRLDPDGHESERVASFIWIGIGLAGAVLGLASARLALKAVWKGTAKKTDMHTALIGMGTTAASVIFTASRITAAVKPDSKAGEAMLWGAIALGIPMLGLRVRPFIKPRLNSWRISRALKSPKAPQPLPVRPSIVMRKGEPIPDGSRTANYIRSSRP